jgi:hypothetical protein
VSLRGRDLERYPTTINEYLDAFPDTDDLGDPWDDTERDRPPRVAQRPVTSRTLGPDSQDPPFRLERCAPLDVNGPGGSNAGSA